MLGSASLDEGRRQREAEAAYEAAVRHRMFRGKESITGDFGVSTDRPAENPELIERLIRFYQRAHDVDPTAGTSMWSGYLNAYNLEAHQALLDGNSSRVAEIWSDPAETDVFSGFEDDMRRGPKTDVLASPFARNLHAQRSYDSLRRLAEALGAVRVEFEEAPHDQRPPPLPVEHIVSEIEREIGAEISFPTPYPSEYGLATHRGVVGYRTVQALYQAVCVRRELARIGGSKVVEIGAGLGRSIYHAFRLGILSYTAVDLPFTAVSQAHFLATTLGSDKVALFGEDDQDRPIRIMPPSAFLSGSERYDIAVNFDSLTEIDLDMAKSYLAQLGERSQALLSVNHEFNHDTVGNLTREGWGCLSRSPYWMRKGYVEEVFTPHVAPVTLTLFERIVGKIARQVRSIAFDDQGRPKRLGT